MIEGVRVKELKVISDNRGSLVEILRSDDEVFEEFGQLYLTTALPGVIKAWHYHKLQSDNFTCVSGNILLALYDARPESPTFGQVDDFNISPQKPKLVHIPTGVYHGFKNIGTCEAIIINTVTKAYSHSNPDEYRVDAHDKKIGYKWGKEK